VSTWGRSDPNDELDESAPRLEKVGRAPRWRLVVALVSIVLVFGLMWAKPWNNLPPPVAAVPEVSFDVPGRATPTPVPTPQPTATPEPVATLGPVALAAKRRQCQSPTDWRMVTAESTVTRETRTMYAAVPAPASGPTDPGLALSQLFAGELRAVGVCVPRSPVVSPTTTLHQVVLWQVEDDGTAREVERPVVMDDDLYDIGEAYFAPPIGEGQYWPQGRYVFEIRRIEGPGSRWIGLEFVPTQTV